MPDGEAGPPPRDLDSEQPPVSSREKAQPAALPSFVLDERRLATVVRVCSFSKSHGIVENEPNLAYTSNGTGPAPILFGSGFVELGTWWKLGALVSVVNIVIWLG